ncbi:MAG: hypothetical protein AAFN09_00200 [Pseudomonadota bacterium]
MSLNRTEIEGLLPFLANDTLAGEERAAVEQAVAADPGLSTELEALRLMRRAMQAETLEASPGELGLARLMRDVEAAPQLQEPAPMAATAPSANDNVVPLRRLRLWQAAAAAVAVLGIGQAVLTSAPDAVTGDLAAIETGEEAGGMRLASGGDAAAQMAVFRAGFAAETTEAELRALLLAADLQIVAGPSALGFYELAPGSAATDLDAAEAALTAAGTLEVLERIAPEGQ